MDKNFREVSRAILFMVEEFSTVEMERKLYESGTKID
jgi:hypothetical protein